MHGRVTAARGIVGERPGERFTRTWTFTPTCPVAACPAIGLVRARAGGTDKLILHQTATNTNRYTGTGSFTAALRCGTHTWRNGERIPFTITVRITAAAPIAGVLVATAIQATYASTARTNLTPCVLPPRVEAARYTGALSAQSPAGT